MDLANNMLSGKLPDFGDVNNAPYVISNGALLQLLPLVVLRSCTGPDSNTACMSTLTEKPYQP